MEFCLAMKRAVFEGVPKAEFLASVKDMPGLYVPGLSKTPVRRVLALGPHAPDLDCPAASAFTGSASAIPDAMLLEVNRGCPHACRFCAAGYIYRPPRHARMADLVRLVEEAAPQKVGLVGTALTDWPDLLPFLRWLAERKTKFSLASMLQLLKSTELDEEQKEYVVNAIKASYRLTRLLSDLLDLSRIESGRVEMRNELFEVANQKESVLDLFALAAREKSVELEFRVSPDMPRWLIGDASRLRQILFNLVGNAIKFTPGGRVTIEALPLGPGVSTTVRVLFIVSDTGIGISDDMLKTIFEPFTQAEGAYSRNFQGAGLGLSIVKKLVLLMDGELAIDNTPGTGTSLFLSLPFKLPGRDPEQKRQAELDMKQDAASGVRVLFAEDDAVSLTAGRRMLEKAGHTVTPAKDGRETLELLRQQNFDVILMDIQMPDMDGLEATKRIRAGEAGEANTAIPILAMTAYVMVGDKEKFLAAGMNGYLAKPVAMEQLQEAIRAAVRQAGPKA